MEVDLHKFDCGGSCDWLINVADFCTLWFVSRNVCGFNWEWKCGFRKIAGMDFFLFSHDFYVNYAKTFCIQLLHTFYMYIYFFMQLRNVLVFNAFI